MGIRAGDREVLCTKNVLRVPRGASGKLPFSPAPYGQPGVIYFSSEIKISPSSCWEDRTKLPADYYSRTKQSIYLSRFRAIISPGHKPQCELPLSTSSPLSSILTERLVPLAGATQKETRERSLLQTRPGKPSFSFLPNDIGIMCPPKDPKQMRGDLGSHLSFGMGGTPHPQMLYSRARRHLCC